MKTSTTLDKLAPALVAACAEMQPVAFDAKNPFFKSKYASLGAVINMSRPILAKHGLTIVQMPTSTSDGQVGIVNVVIHTSGEWIAADLLMKLEPEKGRSLSQTVGAAITYFRRYAWSGTLGIYADEDTDGNGESPSESFESASTTQTTTRAAERSAPAKPATAPPANAKPASAPIASEPSEIAELRKKVGPKGVPAFTWFLRHYDSGNGNPVLPAPKKLADLPADWAKFFVDDWPNTVGKIDIFLASNPMPTEAPKPVEVPRDPTPANGDAWRTYPMPFGEKKDTPLADLDKKYLFGLWANFKVTTEYNGRAKTEAMIKKDTEFRDMLDAAGLHYGFTLK